MATSKRLLTTLLLIGLLVVLSRPVVTSFAAPVWVASGEGGASNLTVTTTSFTVSGSNTYMYCVTSVQNINLAVSSVVMSNGSTPLALKHAKDTDDAGSGTQARAEYWDIKNPPAGSTTVTATMGTATAVALGCSVYSGVDQSNPIGTFTDNGGRTNNPTVTVSSAVGELVVDGSAVRVGTVGLTVGAGQTQRAQKQSAAGAGNVTILLSEEAGAASTVMDWTVDDATPKTWASIGVRLIPVGGGGGGNSLIKRLLLLGVGG